MDTVQTPLPANVVVLKFLAADGFGKSCKAEDRNPVPDAGVGSISAAAGSCSSVRDVKRPVTHLERSSTPGKGSDSEPHNVSSFIVKDGGRRFRAAKYSFLSSPKYLVNHVNKQEQDMGKRRVTCSKRQRTNGLEGSSSSLGAEYNHSLVGKTSSYLNLSCNADNTRLVKQKHCQDGRQSDKRISKMAAKKYLADTYSDELSVDALLDGSYDFSIAIKDKEKKVNDANARIMRTVNKVFSILPIPDRVQPQKDDEHGSDSDQISGARWSLSDCQLYCPKKIHEQLKLSPSNGIDSFLLELRNTTGVIMQSENAEINSARQNPHSVYMPPFPWSLLHCGSSKATIDSGRLLTSKNYWRRWVKIRSKTTLCNSGYSSFQGLDLLMQHLTEKSKQQETDCPVNDRTPLSSSITHEIPGADCSYNHEGVCSVPRADLNGHVCFERGQAICESSASVGNTLRENDRSSFIIEQSEGKFDCTTDGCCFSLNKYTCGRCDQNKWHLSSSVGCLDVSLLAAAEILCELANCYSNAFVGRQHRNHGKNKWIHHKSPPQKAAVAHGKIKEHLDGQSS